MKKKIWIHTDNGFFGGASIALVRLISNLFIDCPEKVIVTCASCDEKLINELEKYNIMIFPLSLGVLNNKYLSKWLRFLGLDLVIIFYFLFFYKKKLKHDTLLVVAGGVPGSASIWAVILFSKLFYNKKIFLWIHSQLLDLKLITSFYSNKIFQKVFHKIIQLKYIFVSDAVRKSFFYKIKTLKNYEFDILPNFIYNNEPAYFEKSNKDVVIAYIGHLIWYKGLIELINVFKLLKDDKDIKCNIKLLIIGDGPLYNDLVKIIEEYNLSSSIDLLKWQNNLDSFYKKIDLLVLLSKQTEGLPTTIIEGLYYGVPTVATKIGGIVEIIEDAKDGFFCDINDLYSIKNIIKKYILMPVYNKNMIRKSCIDKFKQKYSSDVILKKWRSLFI